MITDLIGTPELAALAGIPRDQAIRWARRNGIPAIRTPGGRLRYRAAHVQVAVDAARSGLTPAAIRRLRA